MLAGKKPSEMEENMLPTQTSQNPLVSPTPWASPSRNSLHLQLRDNIRHQRWHARSGQTHRPGAGESSKLQVGHVGKGRAGI